MRAILTQEVGVAATNVSLDGRVLARAYETQGGLSQSSPVGSNTLVVNWITDSGTRTNVQPTYNRYAPAVIFVDVRDSTNFNMHWDVAYDFGDTNNWMIPDPDPTGVRTGARGSNRDWSQDARGPQAGYIYTNSGEYTLSISALNSNGSNKTFTTNVSIQAASWDSTVTIGAGAGADEATWSDAVANNSGDNIRFRFLRGETHDMSGGGTFGGRSNVLVESATNTGDPAILRKTTRSGTMISVGSGTQNRFRDMRWTVNTNSYAANDDTGSPRAFNINTAKMSGAWDIVVDSPGPAATPDHCWNNVLWYSSGAANSADGIVYARITPATNGWSGQGTQIGHGVTLGVAYYGVEWNASKIQNPMRVFGDSGDSLTTEGVTMAWCKGFMDIQNAGGNFNSSIRANGGNWYFLQEGYYDGINFAAVGGGQHTNRNQVAEACFCTSGWEYTGPGQATQLGSTGTNIAWRSCLLRGGPPRLAAPGAGILGKNNASSTAMNVGSYVREIHYIFCTAIVYGADDHQGWQMDSVGVDPVLSNWRLRGNLVVMSNRSMHNLFNFAANSDALGVTNDYNFHLAVTESTENIFPTNAVVANFIGGNDTFASFTNYVDNTVSVNDYSIHYDLTATVAGGASNAWRPDASSNADWRTNATPDLRVKRDYIGNLREQNTNVWSVGAIATNAV